MLSLPRVKIYSINFCKVSWWPVDMWFSYETLVAFCAPECGTVVHQNDWSVTTGRHLSRIDGGDRDKRINDEEFRKLWDKYVAPQLLNYVAPVIGFNADITPEILGDWIKDRQ